MAISDGEQQPRSDDDIDGDLIDCLLTLTPVERVRRHLDAQQLVRARRKGGEIGGASELELIRARDRV